MATMLDGNSALRTTPRVSPELTRDITPNLSVLVVTDYFPHPLQPYVRNLVEEILRPGANVTVAAKRPLGERFLTARDDRGVLQRTRYFPVDSLWDWLRGLRPYLNPSAGAARQAWRGLRRLVTSSECRPSGLKGWAKAVVRAPLLAESHLDLVHAHSLPGAYDYLFVARILRIPLVVTFHGLPPEGVDFLPAHKAAQVFQQAALFLVNTRFARRQLERMGCSADKVCILPQGLRLEDFPYRPRTFPRESPVVLVTVARLTPDKGIRYAIEAVGRLAKRGRCLDYRIAGHGPERASLETLVQELGLEDCVRFLGPLTDAEIQRQYGEAHIFLLPSVQDPTGEHHVETQGLVIQEAQASGTIVIATRTGGIPECVDDGQSAFLVPDRDPEALAEKIAWVLDHPHDWPTWQRQGRRWVETHFALEQIGGRLWEIYGELLKTPSLRNASSAKPVSDTSQDVTGA